MSHEHNPKQRWPVVISLAAIIGTLLIVGGMSYQDNVKTMKDPAAKPRGCETFHGGSGVCDCKGNCYCLTGRSEKCPGCAK